MRSVIDLHCEPGNGIAHEFLKSHGRSPRHHGFQYEVMVIHDLDDFGYPHDLGNLEMALTSIGDPFFRAVDSYRIESSETLWQNTVDNQSQWWRLEHILEVRSVQSCCFSF